MFRYPGLRNKLPELMKKYGGETYAEVVMRIEAESMLAKELRNLLKSRYGKISPEAVRVALRSRGIKARPSVIKFLLKLRELYRLPSPNKILIGPYHDNPILTLLGTYGPMRRDRIVLRLQDVEFRDPVALLAEIYDRIMLKRGRSLDKRRLEIVKYAKGSSGRYIILKKDLPRSERHEKRGVPAVEVSSLLSHDTYIIPLR